MEFRSHYNIVDDRQPKEFNPLVKKFRTLAPYAKDKEGKIINDSPFPKRVENGCTNIDEFIQSFKNDTDLYCLIEKYIKTGDESIINKKQGFYGDFSNLDKMSYNDLRNFSKDFNVKVNSLLKKKQQKEEKAETPQADSQAASVPTSEAAPKVGE